MYYIYNKWVLVLIYLSKMYGQTNTKFEIQYLPKYISHFSLPNISETNWLCSTIKNKHTQKCSAHYDLGDICQLCGPNDTFYTKEVQLIWILSGKLKETWKFETKRDVTRYKEFLIKILTTLTYNYEWQYMAMKHATKTIQSVPLWLQWIIEHYALILKTINYVSTCSLMLT
jgi:hypothetical protein